jgi:hypothetical protein
VVEELDVVVLAWGWLVSSQLLHEMHVLDEKDDGLDGMEMADAEQGSVRFLPTDRWADDEARCASSLSYHS